MHNYLIAPSLLAADFARLGAEAEDVLRAGGDILHLDVMDNHYVPNLTVGPLVCAALRQHGIIAPIAVHLMARPVDRLIVEFAQAGASCITFHPESSDHIDRDLELIRKHHCTAGLAFNPATPINSYLEHVLHKIDNILIMSVNPGFGGQQFILSTLEKLKKTREYIAASGKKIRLVVDGGIKIDNILAAAQAGADTFVVGSGIFTQTDYKQAIYALRQELHKLQI